jgi:hypothetical protein
MLPRRAPTWPPESTMWPTLAAAPVTLPEPTCSLIRDLPFFRKVVTNQKDSEDLSLRSRIMSAPGGRHVRRNSHGPFRGQGMNTSCNITSPTVFFLIVAGSVGV